MTYVLLTRPEEDSQELKAKLIAPAILSPLLKVKQIVKKVTLPAGVTDLIVTSARIFEMVSNIKSMTSIPVWCVGEATANAAKAAGFETIFQVNRSAQEILERIIHECSKDSSHFAHICGSVVHVDLADALTKLGFKADKLIVYETEAAQSLISEAETIMQAGLIQQIPFFSLRTAEVFIELAKKSEWADQLSGVTALAHSEAIARILKQLSWKDIIVVTDLSAERIMEYYKRPGDQPMKQGSLMWQLLTTVAIAAVVSVTVILLWSNSFSNTTETAIRQKIETLSQDVQAIKKQAIQVPELMEKVQSLTETTLHVEHDLLEIKTRKSENIHQHDSTHPAIVRDADESLKLFYHDLTTGSVTPEAIAEANKLLPERHQSPLSVISVRDLADQLQNLPEIKREIKIEVEDSIWQKIIDFIGLRVRRTELVPLKERAANGLKNMDFSFLSAFEQTSLTSEWSEWLKQCQQTKMVLDTLSAHLKQKTLHADGDSE